MFSKRSKASTDSPPRASLTHAHTHISSREETNSRARSLSNRSGPPSPIHARRGSPGVTSSQTPSENNSPEQSSNASPAHSPSPETLRRATLRKNTRGTLKSSLSQSRLEIEQDTTFESVSLERDETAMFRSTSVPVISFKEVRRESNESTHSTQSHHSALNGQTNPPGGWQMFVVREAIRSTIPANGTSSPTLGSVSQKEKEKDKDKGKAATQTMLLLISTEGVRRVDPGSSEVLSTWPLERISGWTLSSGQVRITVPNVLKEPYVVYTEEGLEIRKFLMDSATTLLKEKQKQQQQQNVSQITPQSGSSTTSTQNPGKVDQNTKPDPVGMALNTVKKDQNTETNVPVAAHLPVNIQVSRISLPQPPPLAAAEVPWNRRPPVELDDNISL